MVPAFLIRCTQIVELSLFIELPGFGPWYDTVTLPNLRVPAVKDPCFDRYLLTPNLQRLEFMNTHDTLKSNSLPHLKHLVLYTPSPRALRDWRPSKSFASVGTLDVICHYLAGAFTFDFLLSQGPSDYGQNTHYPFPSLLKLRVMWQLSFYPEKPVCTSLLRVLDHRPELALECPWKMLEISGLSSAQQLERYGGRITEPPTVGWDKRSQEVWERSQLKKLPYIE